MKNIKALVAGPQVTGGFNMALALRGADSFTIEFCYANTEEEALKQIRFVDVIIMETATTLFEETVIKRGLALNKRIMIVPDVRYVEDDLVCKIFHESPGVHSCI